MDGRSEGKGASKTPGEPARSKTGSKIRRAAKTPSRPSRTSSQLIQKERSSSPSLPEMPRSTKHQDDGANQAVLQGVPTKEPTPTSAYGPDSTGRQEELSVYQPSADQPDAIPSNQRPLSRDHGAETPKARRSIKTSRKPSKSPSQQIEKVKSSTSRHPQSLSCQMLQHGDANCLELEVAPTEAPTPTLPEIPGSTGREDKAPECLLAPSQPEDFASSHTLLATSQDQKTEATKAPAQTESTPLLSAASDRLASGAINLPGIEGKTTEFPLAPSGRAPVQVNEEHQSPVHTMENKEAAYLGGQREPDVLSDDSLQNGVRIMSNQVYALGEAHLNEGQCPGDQEEESTDMPKSCQKQTLMTSSHAVVSTAGTTSNIIGSSQKDTGRIIKPSRVIATGQKEPKRSIGEYQTKVHTLRKATTDLESGKNERPTEAKSIDRNLGTAPSEAKTLSAGTPRQTTHKGLEKLHQWTEVNSSCTRYMLVAAVIVVLLAFVALLVFLLSRGRPERTRDDICSTLACEAYSKRLLDSMNISANPCESFTRYVCDGWNRGNELSVNEDTIRAALDRLYRFVIDLKVADSGETTFERAAIFYRSCLCVGRGKCDQLPEVASALLESGIVWPYQARSPDVLRTLLFSSLQLRWGGLFSFEVTSRPREKHIFLRIADEIFLLKWKMDEHLGVSEARRQRYFQVLRDQFGIATSRITKDENLVSFEEMLDLDQNVFKNLFETIQKQPVATIEDYLMDGTVANLTEQRWRDALRDCGVQIKPTDSLVFSSDTIVFVHHFLLLWTQSTDELMHLLVSWCTVQVAALFANQELLVNFHGSLVKAELRNEISCFSKTFLITGRDVLYWYSNYFLPQAFRPMAKELVLDVRQAFRRHVLGWEHYEKNVTVVHDWNSTKVALKYFYDPEVPVSNGETGAIEQREIGEKQPGHHEKFKGDTLVANWRLVAEDLLGDATSIDLANAIKNRDQYLFVSREASPDMTLLPYAFTFPYFDREATRAFNYAGVGTIVAEALGHLFLETKFLSISAQRALYDFIYCMEDSMPNKLSRRNYGRHVEPIALMTSLEAYRAHSEAVQRDRRVKGLEFLSSEQFFFVAACFTRCTGRQDSSHVAWVQCDDTFKHVPEFATVFECKPGAPMNPEERCKLL